MLLLRALNDYDILADPLKNGISSKQMIYDLVKKYYEYDKNSNYSNLSEYERELFIQNHIAEYLKLYNYKLEKLFLKNSNQSREDVKEYKLFLNKIKNKGVDELLDIVRYNDENINFGSYIKFMKHLSELQRHLLYGSSKITDWISTSTNVESMLKYYDMQKIHNVAVIVSNTGGLIDSDNIMSVDLSTFESIEKNSKYLCNKIDDKTNLITDVLADLSRINPTIMLSFKKKEIKETDIKSRGFKYSTNSKEICILRYIPKDHIISILESLQIDLVRCGRFNENFVFKSRKEQKEELIRYKQVLLNQLKRIDNPYLLYLYDEIYIKNRNIKDLVTFNQSKEYIKYNRNKILNLSLKIPSSMIKYK